MARNTFLSAGVYTREFDLSFLPADIPAVGAAIIGQTVRGPAFVPTHLSTYSEYLRLYGDVFSSGSGATEREYKFLTTYAVQEYLRWGEVVTVVRVMAGDFSPSFTNVLSSGSTLTGTYDVNAGDFSFRLESLSDGETTNSGILSAAQSGSGVPADEAANGTLVSGSRSNLRWEIANVDPDRGVFDLYIRRGDDNNFRKVVLEQFTGITLDPNANNYISKVIGDQKYQLRADSSGEPYLELSGSYPNRSRFVRVEVYNNTLNYIKDDGTRRDDAFTGSLPLEASGTFGGGSDGDVAHPRKMYDLIENTNTEGLNPATASVKSAYEDAIDILSNKDQFDFDLLLTPGLIDGFAAHSQIITRAITMVEERGDAFYVIDPTRKGATIGEAINSAQARNTNYGGYYYPWVQIADADLGGNFWVPPSAIVPSVYSFTDQVAEKWFAPAGLNRGGLDMAVQAERLMTQNDRDNLYIKSINPIATFPRTGIVVWGQKTLQKKRSALDRINVRRLLIAAKRHVANTTKTLVFEQNTEETRAQFLNLTRPWFEDARRKQGLYDFRIIIDERNNTPDVVDRNEMRAQIYLKPAKTAEFIIVDFNILATGAEFPIDNEFGG